MALVNMKKMLAEAASKGYAVGQFNINNLEWTMAILDECEAQRSPVILGVSAGAAKYMGGFVTVVNMVKGLIVDRNYTIPIAIHLDHGDSFEICKKALDAGFTSVMIDGSHLALDENIALTRKVVEYAALTDASVEAELGHVGGQEDHVSAEILYAVPEECVRMVKETGIDCLAPALGSVHGPYKGEPKLGFKEMGEIFDLVKIPLVLHGGSGIPEAQIRKAISLGTAKINVNTEFQQIWTAMTREVLASNPDVYDPRKVIGPGKAGIRKVAAEKINLFGSQGRA